MTDTLRLKLIQAPTLKCRVTPFFPGSVEGVSPISVSLVGNIYQVSLTASYQPIDNDLSALAALTGTGLATRTAADTWATRTLAAPAAGLTITNPAGIAGDPTFALANDLAALEGMAGTGLVTRTAADTYAQRTIAGTTNEITLTNGSGVGGNPTVSLPAAITLTGKVITGGTFNAVAQLGVRSSASAFDLRIACSQVFTADRTVTINPGDANRTIAMGGGGINIGGGDFATSGAAITLTAVGATNVTLPTTGTLAALASPAFTGTPTAPTAATNTNTTQLATTAFVQQELATNNVTGAWTTYTPSVTPNTGSITTLGTVTGRHKKIGRIVHFEVDVNITTNGTGAGFINISMPFTSAAFPYFAVGQELNVTGNMLIGHVQASATNMAVTTSAGAYPGGDGRRLTLSGFYEASS